jgi:hypothetical protein
MNPTSEDIKDILADESSLELTFSTNLFFGKEPTDPPDCVTIIDTPGLPPQLTYDKDERYDYPSIQIMVRNKSYADGYDLIDRIKAFLHGKNHFTINDTVYEVVICTTDPAFLSWDSKNNARFVVNFNIQRQPS